MTHPLSGPKRESSLSFRCSEQEGIEAYTFAHKVEEKLENLGLGTNPHRPQLEKEHEAIFSGMKAGQYFDGRLPTVIRTLNLDQISRLFSLYSNWYRYLTIMTRKVATERSEAIRLKEFEWSHIRDALKSQARKNGHKMTEQAASDEARVDHRFVEASSRYEIANCTYEILMAMCNAAEQDMKVISREVTIQQNLWEQKKIGNNFGNRFDDGGQEQGANYGYRPRPASPPTGAAHHNAVGNEERQSHTGATTSGQKAHGRPRIHS